MNFKFPIRRALKDETGSQIVELAVSLPLLVVFVVGIFDFSGALSLKQRLTNAAQESAVIAASQPTRDLDQATPASVIKVGDAAFDYLASNHTLVNANQGGCTKAAANLTGAPYIWTYKIGGCPNTLTVTIDRGNVSTYNGEKVLGTEVTVQYLYAWRFNDVISLVAPGANYAATTMLSEEATALNQL
jgi:Flp pilus assembly protein TadG